MINVTNCTNVNMWLTSIVFFFQKCAVEEFLACIEIMSLGLCDSFNVFRSDVFLLQRLEMA